MDVEQEESENGAAIASVQTVTGSSRFVWVWGVWPTIAALFTRSPTHAHDDRPATVCLSASTAD